MKSLKYFAISIILLIFLNINLFSIDNSALKILESNDKFLEFRYTPQLIGLETKLTDDNQEVKLPIIKDAIIEDDEPGSPISLIVTFKITVPDKDKFSIEQISYTDGVILQGKIAPKEKILFNEDGSIARLSQIEPSKYNHSIRDIIDVRYLGLSRYRHIAEIKLRVAQYDSKSNTIFIPDNIQVKIKFDNTHHFVNYDLKDDIEITINHNETASFLRIPKETVIKKFNDQILTNLNQTWVKIKVSKEGIYRIDANQLAQFGYNNANVHPNTIKIFGNGGKHLSEKVSDAIKNQMNQQPIIIRTKSNGELDYILFYGSPAFGFEYRDGAFYHYINNYSNDNYYLLTWGGDAGKRAIPVDNPTGNIINQPTTYKHLFFFEEEINHGFPYPGSGRVWYGRSIFPFDAVNTLHNLDKSGNVFYRFSVAHRNDKSGKFDIFEGQNKLTSINIASSAGEYTGSTRSWATASINASRLQENRSILKFEYSSEGLSGTPYLDYYEIHYPRSFVPIDNEISFFSDPFLIGLTEYSIGNFTGGETIGYNVTDLTNPILLTNESKSNNLFLFRVEHQKNSPQRYYISSKYNIPPLEKADFGNLRNDFADAEMILITHPALLASAEQYKVYREKQSGIKVAIITTDHIFTEFSSAIPEPTAIRDFIAFAFHNWKVKPYYVLLWGRGHYDYKNIQYNTPQYVLTYQSADDTSYLTGIESYTTDDFFTRIVGEDRINDIIIGRITIDRPSIGFDILEKIKNYENNSSTEIWRTFVTLVADDSPTSKGFDYALHTGQSERLSAGKIPEYLQQKKIYLPDYPSENIPGGKRKPKVTEDLLNTINTRGTLMLNWIGHGNPRVWAHEEILDRDITIPQMLNYNKLFFLTAATCDFARYDTPDKLSGAEEMLFSTKGGAIGVFAATRIVLANSNAVINERFYERLFNYDSKTGKYSTFGEAIFKVKLELSGDNDQKFNLLADPSMRLNLPEAFVTFDRINDIDLPLVNDTIIIKALSEVKIEGSILKLGTDEVDETFNGTVIITMLDGDQLAISIDVDGTKHNILWHGGALNQSSYKVQNGRFIANFIVPKDISYSKYKGRLYAYAISNDKRFAKSSDRSYYVNGIQNWENPDKTPPQIKIYLDSRYFQHCDIVSPEPLLIVDLYDDSGINTTGRGIGHRIEAWIDDNIESIDLTPNFVTSLENPKAGSIEKILFGLKPGKHKVKVRAWDVFNNFAIAETCFEITDKGKIIIGENYAFPNPTETVTTVRFKHNIKPPFEITVKIYTINGQLVKKIVKRGLERYQEEVRWDASDDAGAPVPGGIYIYQIIANDEKIGTGIAFGKVNILK